MQTMVGTNVGRTILGMNAVPIAIGIRMEGVGFLVELFFFSFLNPTFGYFTRYILK
jgi:hypothetical protein